MKKVFLSILICVSCVQAQPFKAAGFSLNFWRDSSGVLVPVPAGKVVFLPNALFGDSLASVDRVIGLLDSLNNKQNRGENYAIGAATGSSLIPSGTSGQFGWFKRNATVPQSGTVSLATATDTVSFATAFFSGPVGIGTTAPGNWAEIARNVTNHDEGLTLRNLNTGGWGTSILFASNLATPGPYYQAKIQATNGDGIDGYLQFYTSDFSQTLQQRMMISNRGSVGIGMAIFPSGGTKTLIFGSDSIAPSGMNTSTAGVYADTVAGVMELRGIDGAGNKTTLTPHNFSMFEPPAEASLPWSFTSQNEYIGKEIAVDMYKLAQLVEQLTGQKLIYERDLADSLVKSWDANQEYHYQLSVKQRQSEWESYDKALTDWTEKTKGLKDDEIDWSTRPKLIQSPLAIKVAAPAWLKSRLKIPSQL